MVTGLYPPMGRLLPRRRLLAIVATGPSARAQRIDEEEEEAPA